MVSEFVAVKLQLKEHKSEVLSLNIIRVSVITDEYFHIIYQLLLWSLMLSKNIETPAV